MADPVLSARNESRPWHWYVAQAGAREHYATARAFQRSGQLALLFTEAWCRFGAGALKRGPAVLRAFAGRRHSEIPDHQVKSFSPGAIAWTLHRSLIARPRTIDQAMRWEVANSEWFDRRVRSSLRRRTLDPTVDCFFGYQSECCDTLAHLGQRGVFTMMDMAGPGRAEEQLVMEEMQRWPDWVESVEPIPECYYERVQTEWSHASLILVNSPWSKQALVSQGVPAEKLVVVPLAYEPPHHSIQPRSRTERPLTVLWLGSVILRKGIQYLFEAARRLQDRQVEFIIAGPVRITSKAVHSAPSNVKMIGRLTHDMASEMYRKAHVFVLPTISDGFAITQLEAMAHGVPVIATPHCGEVVTDGVDGLIVPIRDSERLAQAIAKLDDDRDLLAEMSRCALEKSRRFTIERFGEMVNDARDRYAASTSLAKVR